MSGGCLPVCWIGRAAPEVQASLFRETNFQGRWRWLEPAKGDVHRQAHRRHPGRAQGRLLRRADQHQPPDRRRPPDRPDEAGRRRAGTGRRLPAPIARGRNFGLGVIRGPGRGQSGPLLPRARSKGGSRIFDDWPRPHRPLRRGLCYCGASAAFKSPATSSWPSLAAESDGVGPSLFTAWTSSP